MAFIASGIIAGVGAIGGALINSSAAGSAADKQAAAANHASDLQNQQYQQTRADQEPWRQAGAQALGQLGNSDFQRDFTMNDFQADPGYAFRLQQGQQALERSAAARGGLNSGAFAKSLNDYAQGAASQEYGNAYNRFNNDRTNRFNRLSSIAGLGQTANSQLASAGQNYANNVGANAMTAAQGYGNAGMAKANAWGSALGGIGNNWMQMQMMNRMMPKQNPAGWVGSHNYDPSPNDSLAAGGY